MLSPATPGSAQGTGMGRLLELLPGGFVSPNLFSALQGALRDYSRLIHLQPWMPESYLFRGKCHAAAGDVQAGLPAAGRWRP